MQNSKLFSFGSLAFIAAAAFGAPVWALTGVQVGPSGKTYASAEVQCSLNPVTGMAPMVQAGLYNPQRNASATVSLNGAAIGKVTFLSPDTTVWLANGLNTVGVALNKKASDTYSFDASSDQANVCIPDTGANTVSGGMEYAATLKSYATVVPGCAFNSLTGQAQPYVHLFANGTYLLNVSVNNAPLTQLNGTTRLHTPVFLSAGLNVISAANGAVSTDYYVRDGGAGSCTLP
jgi:hypothetical protein